MHAALEVAPLVVEKVPGSQRDVHALAFVAADHDPGSQLGHKGSAVATVGYAVPGGHAYGTHTGALLPAGGPAVPTGHSCATHVAALIALGVGDHDPAGHDVQSIAEMAPGA